MRPEVDIPVAISNIFSLGVADNHGADAQFRDQLACFAHADADSFRTQQTYEFPLVSQVGPSRVARAEPFPLRFAQAQFLPYVLVHPGGQAFGQLHSQAVQEKATAVLVAGKKFFFQG